MTDSIHNMVSVFMLVYNQEQYIKQTLDSILGQQTNFAFNLVIGEDCSTDNTLSILKDYQARYPKKIKIISSDQNVGLIANFVRTIKACDGKYIAICDGDDYWIDDNKLQKQVDFLETHSGFSIVFTDKNDLYSDGTIVAPKQKKQKVSGFDDLIKGNYIASVTVLFKNSFFNKDLPHWLLKYPYGDWPVYLMTVNDGSKIKFLDCVTANYRKDTGASARLRKKPSEVTRINLNILEDLVNDDYFLPNKQSINKSILLHQLQLMKAYNREKQYFRAFSLYLKLLFKVNLFQLKKQYLHSFFKSFN